MPAGFQPFSIKRCINVVSTLKQQLTLFQPAGLYCIQEKVGSERRRFGNRKEDVLIARMRIGHCLLNQCLHRIGKHENGNCDKCGLTENVEHDKM